MEGNGNEKDLEEEDPKDVLKSLIPDKNIRSKLFPHQREGIVFFYNAYKNGKSRAKENLNGVILADEMGLGKSIQVILFLHGMIMNTQEFKHALLIVPAGLLDDWMDKLKTWTPKMNVLIYHHRNTELQIQLMHLQETSGVLLVSYSTFINRYNSLGTYKGKHFSWDCMICDEAHKLKNPATKTHKAVAFIPTAFNILITGTPMQNNLKEFWSLFSFISDTYLLGTYKTFKKEFETPITKGMEADSGPEERALGMELQKTLKKITEPFYLRRTKAQMQDHRAPPALQNIPSEQVLTFPKKNEYVVWIKMTPEQEAAYRKITDDTPTLSLQSSHSLIAVCTYPRSYSDVNKHEVSKVHLGASGKLTFMLALLESFATNGNFALVFSNYIKVLDIIQNSLTQTAWGKKAFLRIDGQNINERDNIIKRFQERGSKTILLLTTNVGSEGLTLTAADCVVFADLSWNQSQDAQAVGRAHRIGQTKDVQTYRLITCGTLEERIYRRQLFKGSLTRQVVGDEKNPLRHFTQDQLKGIFTLQETRVSSTQQQLEKQGAKYLNITEVFGAGFNSVAVASVCGISDHGQLLRASQGEDLEVDMARMHITETVKMSQQQIEAESHLTRQQIRTGGPVKKPVRKDKIRRRSHEPRTPGLPRKYKRYTPPFSGTRRKTVHHSKPCIVESSDSSNFSTDDEVNLSENAVPHILVSVKSKITGDSVNQRSVSSFMCNKDNDGIPELSQESTCYGTESISRPPSCSLPNSGYLHKSCSEGSIHLNTETVKNNDEDANSFSCEMSDLPGKSMCQASPCTDKTIQMAYDERISEDIAHITESDWVNQNDHDQVKVLCNVSVQSSDQGFRSGSIMQESELDEPSAFHEEIIPEGVVSSEVGQQQARVIDDKILTSRDTLDISDHISKCHSSADLDTNVPPATDVNEDMSSVTNLDPDKSSVDVVNEPSSTSTSHKDIGIPDKPSDSEYCNSNSYNNRTSLSNTRGAHSYYTCPNGNYMEEHETSHLQETSSDLTNSAIVSMSICLSDLSLAQPSESDKLIDFKQEASSHEVKFIDPVEQEHLVNGVHEEIVHPKRPQILNTHPCDDLSHSFIPVHPSELQETATLNQEGQEVQLTSEDIEVNMARMNIRETVKLPWLEAEAESHLTSQPFCTDVSVKKRVRKDRIRRRSHEPRTPGLPRKYKCYTSPLSGTRRKTVHLSKPCIVESSDTFNLSTDDEVNLSENAVPHNAVSLKTEITDDLVNQHSISSFMCSTMCNEDNDGIMDISQESTCYDTESISRPPSCSLPNSSYLHKSCSEGSIHLNTETVKNNDEDANSFSCEMSDLPGKSMCQASPCTDKTKQTAHVSRSSLFDSSYSSSTTADERISEDIAHITESDWVNQNDHDQVKVLCNVSVQSGDQGFRSGSVMQESELDEPSAFHEEIIPEGVVSSEVGQQQTRVIDDKILTSKDTLDFSDHISRCHSNADLDTNVPPATDVNEDMSSVTKSDLDKSSVDVVNEPSSTSTSQEDIGIPDKPSDSEYCNSNSYNNRTSLSNTRGAHSYYTCPKGTYMEEHETSHLQETSSDLTNSAIRTGS
ncbi:hypothetical protein NFI96_006147 [Prochilodus magdalenae]|nr:hypothetical protein NFI96_006147 [Prochilodus magdalenae]